MRHDDGMRAAGPEGVATELTASISPGERARRTDTPASSSGAPSAAPGATSPRVALPVDPTERYQLAGVHARGGLGRVVKARDLRLGRTVAIKELLHRTAAGEARFVREALITARLEHPGIVPVHEAGRWPSGDPYYSMKLVSGRTLKELVRARPELDERLALVPHVLAVAEAIGYAHSLGVIHRDLKPANVVVGDFGETVVVDWGLAKDLTGDLPGTQFDEPGAGPAGKDPEDSEVVTAEGKAEGTAEGKVMGTPAYMSPEQARGDDVDARADVFSLGALLFEVLVGEPPYKGGSSEAILERAIAGPVPPVEGRQPGAPPDLCAIVRKATAPLPDDRYQSGKELAADLKRFQTGQLVTARTYQARTLAWRWVLRHRALVAASLAFLVAAGVVGALAIDDVIHERNNAELQRAAAERSQLEAESKKDELVFLQAQSTLRRDPTAAVAWMKDYPSAGGRADRLAEMLDEARANGVARHVWRESGWVYGVAILPGLEVATAGMSGEVHVRRLSDGGDRLLGRHRRADGSPIGVISLEASPDGRQLATADEDGGLYLWDVASGNHITVPPTGDPIDHLLYSRDGRRLVAPPRDDASRVLDAATGEVVWSAPAGIHVVALSGDGGTAVTASRDGALARAPLTGGMSRPIATLPSGVLRAALSPDERRLLIQGADDGIRMVELETGMVRELGRQPAMFGSASFSPSGRWAVVGGTDMTIRLFEVASGHETILRGHEDAVYHVLFTPDEQQLVSASDDSTIRLWHIRSGAVRVLRGHDDDVVRLALSADGRWLASAGLDASARMWSLAHDDSRVLLGHHDEVVSFFLVGDDDLRIGDAYGKASRWNLGDGTSSEFSVPVHSSHRASPLLSLDGRWAAVVRDGSSPLLVELASGTQRSLELGPTYQVKNASFSVGGDQLAVLDKAGGVTIWPLPGGEHRRLIEDRSATSIAFSPDGRMLAVAAKEMLVTYDTTTGRKVGSADLAAIGCDALHVLAVVWSPDGRFVTVASRRGAVPLWNVATGELRRLDAGSHGSTRLAFSPDGSWLAAGSTDRKVRMWQTATGARLVLPGHTDLIMTVAFSPDGQTLASASYDKTVRLWRVGSLDARVLRGHTASVDGLVFLPDGHTLASASRDGTVRLWSLAGEGDLGPAGLRRRLVELTSAAVDAGGRPTTSAR